MFINPRLLSIFTILNLIATAGIGWYVCTKDSRDLSTLEGSLEELAEKDPRFFVSLLNKSANDNLKSTEKSLEKNIFQNKEKIIKAGFCIKHHSGNELVVFADMTDAGSLMYLQNVQKALPKMNCSVFIVPISMFGKKSVEQAELIWAASLQSPEKAFQLALTYNAVEGSKNNTMAEAKKLKLDTKKISFDKGTKHVHEDVFSKTKLAEKLDIASPSIYLFTPTEAYILPPAEATDVPELIEHPQNSLVIND
jgi:hypothetical protein